MEDWVIPRKIFLVFAGLYDPILTNARNRFRLIERPCTDITNNFYLPEG